MIKVVFVSFLLFLSVYFSLGQEKDIKPSIRDYIELQVKTDKDTVSTIGKLVVTAVYKNKTDSTLLFYPRHLMYVRRPMLNDGEEVAFIQYSPDKESILVDNAMDFSIVGSIESGGIYEVTYEIEGNTPFFNEGWNYMQLFYISGSKNKNKSRRRNSYNIPYGEKHYGVLISNPFSVYVIDEK